MKTLTLFDFTVFTNKKTFYAHYEEGDLHISIEHTPNNYFLTRSYRGERNTFGNLTMAQALEIANKIYLNYLKLKQL